MKRERWTSSLGFVAAAAGSAVGLVNIWRFPYIVGEHGGAAFIVVYIGFLVLIGFPVLISEVLIGQSAKQGPARALKTLSGSNTWGSVGKGICVTGFIVSSFYSVVAGWMLGYLVLSLTGGLHSAESMSSARLLFESKLGSSSWCLAYHALFMGLAASLLVLGVRRGIEAVNRYCMPILVVLLVALAAWGISLPGGSSALHFLVTPDWSQLTPIAILTALGHAFFTLSLGQGTMITYGSYLKGKENLTRTCAPIVFFDTAISLLAAVAVISLVLAGGEEPAGGPGLVFFTLPAAFAAIPGGQVVAVGFFLLVVLAALTSQISAMEPLINHLVNDRGWKRRKAVLLSAGGGFLLGIPSALSFNLLSGWTIGGKTFFDWISFLTTDVLIPLGGLAAVLFVGWKWGIKGALDQLAERDGTITFSGRTLRTYLNVCVRFAAPLLIVVVLLANLGIV